MRLPSLFGPATAGLSTVLHLAHALSFHAVDQPLLDLDPLGQVALTGDFDAVTFYSYSEQADTPARDNDTHAILTPLPNGILTSLANSDASIRAMCPFTKKDGSFAGIFVGGNFTSLGGEETQGAALYDPETDKVTALPGLSGSVSAVLCDQDTDSVYVGGEFKYRNTSNAVAWTGDKGWSSLLFGGFNGPVTSILKHDDGHIIFGGAFDGIGNSTSSKKNQQIVNLQDAKITSDAVSSKSGFKDPRNVICQTTGSDGEGKTWLLEDYSPGFWRADMRFEFYPTKVRVYNTHLEGRGTKAFLFRRLPDNGIMNMTYTDPDSGDEVHCDSSCALSDSTDELYRDFKFVNTVGMWGFQFEVLDWYGAGAGLNGLQLYTDDILSYAVSDFNEPTCAGIENPSTSSNTGSWSVTGSHESQADYLTAKVTDSTTASVTFEPDVKQSGNYSVIVYTPGCSQDGTCDSRGIVNVTATVTDSGAEPIESHIYQTNLYDKYDTIYTGYVDASDDSFRPSVTLKPIAGQGDITVVASRVRFGLIHASGGLSGELNGLFDFDPSSKKINTDFSSSSINRAGLELDSKASIETLALHDGVVYAGGNFSSDAGVREIMFLNEDGNATTMSHGGLNSQVASMAVLDDLLYVGGNFTDTSDQSNSDLKHVAAYSFSDKSWTSLGGGVNGPVNRVLAINLNVSVDINETTIGVSGDFDRLLEFDDSPATSVNGFAVWVPSRKNWLQNLNVTQMEFAGQLSAFTKVDNSTILAGSLFSGGLSAGSAVALLHEEDMALTPLLQKSGSTGGTYTGVYDMSEDRNLTILGGRFTTTASDHSKVQNLAIIDGKEGTISGIGDGIDSNSTFLSMVVSENTLYAGGNVTGKVGETILNGFVLYDLENGTISETQPQRFTGEVVSVNTIATRPGSKEIYFGGQFENAGALPCPGICFYDPVEHEWTRPGASLMGTVLAIKWMSKNEMIAVGDLDVGGNKTVVATYTTKDGSQEWESFEGASADDIPGTVTAFSPASEDVSKFWLAGVSEKGSNFLANYNGTGFVFTDDLFDDGTTIRGLEVLPISHDHDDVSLLNDDQILLVTGQLMVPDFGHASAALFNGTALTPFIITSDSDGQPGSISQLFYENKNPYKREEDHHSNGIVVLVSFCCALGTVFLIVIAGVIFNKIQRRRQGYMPGPQTLPQNPASTMQRLPPEYLFNSLKQPNPGAPAI